MKAVVFVVVGDVRVEKVEEARIVDDTDRVVEAHRTAMCERELLTP